jgi:putative acyl-CoA dehydrogenase
MRISHRLLGSVLATHEVFNQSPLLRDFNVFTSNRRLQESLEVCNVSKQSVTMLADYGRTVGSGEWLERAELANANPPVFTPFDIQGRRIDSVTFHSAYHELMSVAISAGVPHPHRAGGHLPRAALSYMHYQLEQGTSCPLTMTYACLPVLLAANTNGAFDDWIAKLKSAKYDRLDAHISAKAGATCGMSMTEKQGGSDVRSNTTKAVFADASRRNGENGARYELTGHKWFTSAPMCDAFLTLAYTAEGMSCFLVPRWLEPSQRNVGLRFQRLKNKLGDKSNASSEVEYYGAIGYLVGGLGHGIRTIIEMVNHTRLDCMLGSAALLQMSMFFAINNALHRNAFGGTLVAKPLMKNVLCDLALECEGATALAMCVASSFDDPSRDAYKRLAVAIGKYYICKRAPAVVYEALECLGGNGYVEDYPLARYFRQSPLNAIWEGSGNVIVLDIFRAVAREPSSLEAVVSDILSTSHPLLTNEVKALLQEIHRGGADLEMSGRVVAERLALLLQASALFHAGPRDVFDAFVRSRIEHKRCALFGTLDKSCVSDVLLHRHVAAK